MLSRFKIPKLPFRNSHNGSSSSTTAATSFVRPKDEEKGDESTDLLLGDEDGEEETPYVTIIGPIARAQRVGWGAVHSVVKMLSPHVRCVHYLLSVLYPGFYEAKKIRSTSWLDGLRGYAAFFVVLHHASLPFFDWDVHHGWGAKPPATGWLGVLVRLPIVRLIISGGPHVAIFFVISGYAISYRPLSLAHQGRYAEVGTTLSSAIFRRHPRLYLPAAVTTLCTALLTQYTRHWFIDSRLKAAVPARIPPMKNSLSEQLEHWWGTMKAHTQPLGRGFADGVGSNVFDTPYDYNLWTLPIEFASSMVIFLVIGAFTRVRSRARMAFVLAALIYVEYEFVFWAMFLFLSGMLMCDLRLELDEAGCVNAAMPRPQPMLADAGSSMTCPNHATTSPPWLRGSQSVLPLWVRSRRQIFTLSPITAATNRARLSMVRYALAGVGFAVALWLMSTPETIYGGKETSVGFGKMTSSLDEQYQDHLIVPIGAVLLVFTVDHTKFLQGLYTSRVAQYLGRISYSLYLVHGPLLWSLGINLCHFSLKLIGWGSPFWYCASIFLGLSVWLAIVISIADLTNRYVDEQSVRFGKWAYNKAVRKDE